jgi:DnaK suppressor protein
MKTKKRVSQKVMRKSSSEAKGKRETKGRMGKTDPRAAFLENLLVKKKDLQDALNRLLDIQKEYGRELSAGEFIDELDDAQREISVQSHYSLIERKIAELQKIELRIDSMSKDEKFGICEECGGPIPKKRLLIVPEATLCVPCQQRLEKLDGMKSIVSRTYGSFGGPKGTGWESSRGYDDENHVVIESPIGDLSMDDLEETETENGA